MLTTQPEWTANLCSGGHRNDHLRFYCLEPIPYLESIPRARQHRLARFHACLAPRPDVPLLHFLTKRLPLAPLSAVHFASTSEPPSDAVTRGAHRRTITRARQAPAPSRTSATSPCCAQSTSTKPLRDVSSLRPHLPTFTRASAHGHRHVRSLNVVLLGLRGDHPSDLCRGPLGEGEVCYQQYRLSEIRRVISSKDSNVVCMSYLP